MPKNLVNVDEREYDYVIVDFLNWAHKYNWVFRNLSVNGKQTGIIYGMFKLFFKIQNEFNPKKIIYCFEGYKNKRKIISKSYKSDRSKQQDSFWNQINEFKEIAKHFKKQLVMACSFGYEADDVAFKLARHYSAKNKVLLYSEDSDWQFIINNENIFQFRSKYKKQKNVFLNLEGVKGDFEKDHGINHQYNFLFRCLYGVGHNFVKGVFNKRDTKKIINYLYSTGILPTILTDEFEIDVSSLVNHLFNTDILITKEQLDNLNNNINLVKFYSPSQLNKIQAKFDKEKMLKYFNKMNMKSLIKLL